MDKHERLIRPIREILLPLVVLLAFASCVRLVRTAFFPVVQAHSWQSAKPADITQDPHYRILMENAQDVFLCSHFLRARRASCGMSIII